MRPPSSYPSPMDPAPLPSRPRVVLIGASNVAREASTVLGTAKIVLGVDACDVFGAFGYGRSYGVQSVFLGRAIPSVLHCGLWDALARDIARDPAGTPRPTYALVTDVGNDVVYGSPASQILEWVRETLDRLVALRARIVLTGLPLRSVDDVSPLTFELTKRLLFPRHPVKRDEALSTAVEVDAALERLAGERDIPFVPQRLEWFGLDPIHIRLGMWAEAWREILAPWRDLGDDDALTPPLKAAASSEREDGRVEPESIFGPIEPAWRRLPLARADLNRWFSLLRARPMRYWSLGRPRGRPQPDARLADGSLVHLY